jgi:putative aldouronate transport system permease protein
MKRLSLQDRIFDGVNYTFLTFILLLVLYPLWFVVIASFSEPDLVNAGKVWLIPRGFNLDGYVRLMDEKRIWSGYLNSFFYLFAGTTINLFLTIPAAYALSRKDFVGRNFFILIVTITMFFSGGLIPLYLVVKGLGILNTRWAMILPQAVIAWNLIVTRTFFRPVYLRNFWMPPE